MRIVFRRSKKEEQDHEFVFGVLFASLLALVGAVVSFLPPDLAPDCAFRTRTGIPCPSCGTVRSIRCLIRGELLESFAIQPLMTVLILLGVLYALYAWIVVLFRLPRVRLKSVPRRFIWGALVVLVLLGLANWGYLLLAGR